MAAFVLAGQGAQAKTLEDVLKEKGVITEADYKEVTKSKLVDYKLGKGFTFTSADEKFQLTIGGRAMVRYSFIDKDLNGGLNGATPPVSVRASDVSQFALKTGQLWWTGYAFTKDLTYNVRINVANSGKNTMLETAFVKYRLIDEVQILAGQTKPAFGRQNLAGVGAQEFVDMSPATTAFAPGYDLGAYLSGNVLGGILTYDLSASNGVGATTARSTNNMAFLARLQVNPLGAFAYSEADPEFSQKPLVTVGSSYYSNALQRTATGFEENNLGYANTSTGWLGKNVATFNATEKVDINSFEIDAAFKWMGAFAQAEYFWGQADGALTDRTVRAQGYYVQAGYTILPKKLEVAMRYSYVDPNRDRSDDLQTEVIGAISYYFSNHNLKLQGDVGNIHTQGQQTDAITGQKKAIDDMQYRLQVCLVF
ncbi:MAG: porin [Deltaproteobacteria bacterium]|nr:porin [Deltaproteobacteria bacterium]